MAEKVLIYEKRRSSDKRRKAENKGRSRQTEVEMRVKKTKKKILAETTWLLSQVKP